MRCYLIVGNQTLMGPELAAAIAERIVPGDPPDFYVVVPATPFKFYLDADPAVRAERRHAELAGKGATTDPAEVARQLAERDERDSSRTASPLQAAADAFHINTGGLLPEEVVDVMVAEIRQRSDRT